jgi:hypothetical protein
MLKNNSEIFEQIKDELQEYEITNEDLFTDAIYQITDGMIDIYTSDLFDSVEFLYEQGLLDRDSRRFITSNTRSTIHLLSRYC